MFDNIGRKIQGAAKFVCWVGIGACALTGVIGLFSAGSFWMGLVVLLGAALGALGCWVGSWMVYAFGQMVEDVHEIRVHGGRTEVTVSMDGEKKTVVAAEKPAASFGAKWKCSKCGKENPVFRGTCQNCGTDKFNRPGASVSSGPVWRCTKCGSENPVSRASCKDCGAYK